MAHITKDRVAEESTSTGTGDFTLAGTLTGFRTFASVCSTGDTLDYMIEAVDSDGIPTGDWETGLGTYSAANTLTRTVVQDSSNSGSAVSFTSGDKRVYIARTATSTRRGTSVSKESGITGVDYSSLTAVAWDTENFSYDGAWSAGNPTRLTAQLSGPHLANAMMRVTNFTAGGSQVVYLQHKDSAGTTLASRHQALIRYTASSTTWTLAATEIFDMDAGDYIELSLWMQSDSSIDITSGLNSFSLTPLVAADGGGGHSFSGASVHNASPTSLSVATTVTFPDWDTVDYDVGGWHSSAAEDRLTVPAGVTYAASCVALDRSSVTDQFVVNIQLYTSGGSLVRIWTNETDTAGGETITVTTGPMPVGEGYYFISRYYATNGGTVASGTGTHFTAWAVEGVANTLVTPTLEGTTFPSSPVDGQRFYRTDRNIEYYYDLAGTRWLSTTRHKMMPDSNQVSALPASFSSGTANGLGHFGHPSWDYDVLVERVSVSGRCTGTGGQFDIVFDFINAAGSSIGSTTLEYDYSGTTDPNNETATLSLVWPKQGRGSWYMNRNSGSFLGYPVGMIEYRLIG